MILKQRLLYPGLGGVMDIASSIIFHEQNESTRACCFQILDAIFPTDLYSDHIEITTAVSNKS